MCVNYSWLKQYWFEDSNIGRDNIDFGREIYFILNDEFQFMLMICELIMQYYPNSSELVDLMELLKDRKRWNTAHDHFDCTRQKLIEMSTDSNETNKYNMHLLGLVEIMLKLVYNLTNPLDPFDMDTGWWLVPSYKNILITFNDPQILDVGWNIIADGIYTNKALELKDLLYEIDNYGEEAELISTIICSMLNIYGL